MPSYVSLCVGKARENVQHIVHTHSPYVTRYISSNIGSTSRHGRPSCTFFFIKNRSKEKKRKACIDASTRYDIDNDDEITYVGR